MCHPLLSLIHILILQDVEKVRNLVWFPLIWLSICDTALAAKHSLIEAHILNEGPASGPMLLCSIKRIRLLSRGFPEANQKGGCNATRPKKVD